jgi:hypothetical protein
MKTAITLVECKCPTYHLQVSIPIIKGQLQDLLLKDLLLRDLLLLMV